MTGSVRFLPAGDTALVVEFGDAIDRALSARVLRLAERLADAEVPGLVETLPSFRSLLVHYDPLVTSGDALEARLGGFLGDDEGRPRAARLWRVPTCYERALAPDLDAVAESCGLTTAEVVALHSRTPFHVYMIGFVPGFPYLGDVPEPIRLPRRRDPRVRVPPGSVAIATALTAIYPLESPGGWHLIGRTPIRLMDERRAAPVLLSPGDAVRFEPVPLAEYERVGEAVRRGDYALPCEEAAG